MIKRIKRFLTALSSNSHKINQIQESLGRIEARQTKNVDDHKDSEFRVFSQWGEDGIIQFLINKIEIENKIFVEFGVENYLESNTRFLLSNNYWSGLVIDGSENNINFIKQDPIYWATNLKAVHSFITKDNINDILTSNGIKGNIGILSVDIDGVDYWVWEAIDCISPSIVIAEYNSHFGPTAQVTVPYSHDFVRDDIHFSKIYYGASISALNGLAIKKGYKLVASNSAGNNLFFVRDDLMQNLDELTVQEAYVESEFREYHDENGHLTFFNFQDRFEKIKHLEIFDITSGSNIKIADI